MLIKSKLCPNMINKIGIVGTISRPQELGAPVIITIMLEIVIV